MFERRDFERGEPLPGVGGIFLMSPLGAQWGTNESHMGPHVERHMGLQLGPHTGLTWVPHRPRMAEAEAKAEAEAEAEAKAYTQAPSNLLVASLS